MTVGASTSHHRRRSERLIRRVLTRPTLTCHATRCCLLSRHILPRPAYAALESWNTTRDRGERVLQHAGAPAHGGGVPAALLSCARMAPPSSRSSGPIFLGGVDRSGIGLLGEVLECHPDVSMTRRTNFWSLYAGRFGDLSAPVAVDRCLDEMMRNRRMRVLAPDRDRLHADLARGPATYERLFALLQLQLMERRGCSRWGDKSLGAERFADTILSAYPSASMVHVLRDPRDRYASQATHRTNRRSGAGRGAALWHWSERLARRHSRRFSDRYLVVRYEDLVMDPDRILGQIRDLLGLDPSTGPIAPTPFTTSSVARHRRDLDARDRRFLELSLGSGMHRWGYEPDSSDRTISQAISFWTRTVPLESVRAAAWTTSRTIRQRGRTAVSDRRLDDGDQEEVDRP